MKIILVFVTLLVAACSFSSQSLVKAFENQSTSMLWSMHAQSSDLRTLMAIEAELGSRGEFKLNNYRYLGSKTASSIGRNSFSRNSAPTDLLNCRDFKNGAHAQKFFLQAGGPTSDPHGLDRDGDGFACEWGTKIRKNYAKAQRATYRPVYKPKCHIGPRGGRYTLTASRRKNYGGC